MERKRYGAVLTVALLLSGCAGACAQIGVIGDGSIGDGAAGGGALGGLPAPAVSGCTPPGSGSTLALFYDADQPGDSNVPTDLGTQGAGDMTAVGSPTYNATGGPSAEGAAWEFSGTGQNYQDTAVTSVGPPYTIWCIALDTANGAADKSPCTVAAGPRHYAANAIRSTEGSTARGPLLAVTDAGQWAVYALTVTTGSDTLTFRNDTDDESGTASVSEAASGTTAMMSGEPGLLLDWQGSVAVWGLNSATIAVDDILTYAACEYPSEFTAP